MDCDRDGIPYPPAPVWLGEIISQKTAEGMAASPFGTLWEDVNGIDLSVNSSAAGGSQTPSMRTASFRRGFKNFVDAVLLGIEDPFELIEPCDDVYCCFRKKHGQRLK